MLANAAVMGFIPTRDFAEARAFYVDILGLAFVSQDEFALEVESNGTHIRIAKVQEFTPFPFTILGWRVPEIVPAVRSLADKASSSSAISISSTMKTASGPHPRHQDRMVPRS